MTLRHFPQSFEFSTLGGWIATRAGGHFATVETHIDDLVESIRAVTPAGVWESRRLPGSGAGPSPDRLLLGSEGTLGVITEAWVRVRPRPTSASARPAWRSATFARGAEAVRELSQSGLHPSNCRLIDPLEARLHGHRRRRRARCSCSASSRPTTHVGAVDGAGAGDRARARRRGRGARRAATPWARGAAAFLRAPYLRDTFVALRGPQRHVRDRDHVGALPGVPRAGARRPSREAAGERAHVSCRFTHVYPDGPAPYYTVIAPARRGEEVEQWAAIKAAASDARHRRPAARSPTTTPSAATTGPGTTASAPTRSPPRCAGAKAAVDPRGILNPGVLLDSSALHGLGGLRPCRRCVRRRPRRSAVAGRPRRRRRRSTCRRSTECGDARCAAPRPAASRAPRRAVDVRATIARYERGGAHRRRGRRALRGRVRARAAGARAACRGRGAAELRRGHRASSRRSRAAATLTVSRMPVLFEQLERNTRLVVAQRPAGRGAAPRPKASRAPAATAPGRRARRSSATVVYQWYPGQGLQIQQLGDVRPRQRAGQGVHRARRPKGFECRPRAVARGARPRSSSSPPSAAASSPGSTTSRFGGGLAAVDQRAGAGHGDAGARAAARSYFDDPRYLEAAKRALGAFSTARPARRARARRQPATTSSSTRSTRGLRVLNGFLQSLVGLYDYAEAADDDEARALFASGERQARQEVPRHDTGAWSLLQRAAAPSPTSATTASLRDFLAVAVRPHEGATPYCATADRFTRYLHERTRLTLHRATAPRPRRTATVTFSLSKISCVTLRVSPRRAAGRRPSSRVLGRGTRDARRGARRARALRRSRSQARDLVGHYTRAHPHDGPRSR